MDAGVITFAFLIALTVGFAILVAVLRRKSPPN